MSFKLRTATHDDVDAMCDIYLSAFKDDVFSRQIFPRNSPASLEYWRKTLTEELKESYATFFVATDTTPSTSPETIVGFVKWVAPGAPYHDVDYDGYPEDGHPAIAVEFFEQAFAAHRRIMGDTPHWYLDFIAVRQEWMGRGASKQLMNWGLERTKADGIPCFVESTALARSFYEKHGFRFIEEMRVETPEGDAKIFFMILDVV
ncbi:hypothetical protein PT974_07185 [Cladobotryum mycophilum]|uniref:N-acetyltransferase domain-containing protein n=1 Tax=Cladobotryum mycophilum TaxID=491253 RepID=A0ABR0SNJ2_9HYPO